jgi:radical SAM-linked protein
MERLELHFSRGEEAKYVAHLDLMRAWERAIRRAGIPLAYSQGFSPHARFATGAPLSVGMTSEAEAMDLWLDEDMLPEDILQRLRPQLPDGLALRAVAERPEVGASLASRLREAEYKVTVRGDAVAEAVGQMLAATSIPWRDERGGKVREHDLRPLILDLQAGPGGDDTWELRMRLLAGPAGTGRPQEVVAALRAEALSYHRARLVFADNV